MPVRGRRQGRRSTGRWVGAALAVLLLGCCVALVVALVILPRLGTGTGLVTDGVGHTRVAAGGPVAYVSTLTRPDRVVAAAAPFGGRWCGAADLDLSVGGAVALAGDRTSYAIDVVNTGSTACTVPGRLALQSPPGWVVSGLSTPDVYLHQGQQAVVSIAVRDGCPAFGSGTVIRTIGLRIGAVSTTVPGTLIDVSCGTPVLADLTPPPAPDTDPAPGTLAAVRSTAAMPGSVVAGRAVHYAVTLVNDTGAAVPLADCPTFTQRLTADGGQGSFQSTGRLNCGAVSELPAHSSRTFAMQLDVPTTMAVGGASMQWWLDRYPTAVHAGGRIAVNG